MVQYNATIDALMTLIRREKCPPSSEFVQAILMAFLNGPASNKTNGSHTPDSESIKFFLEIYSVTENLISHVTNLNEKASLPNPTRVAKESIPIVAPISSALPAASAAAKAFFPAAAAVAKFRAQVICFNCSEEGHTLYRCTTPCQLTCCPRAVNPKRHGRSSIPVHAAKSCPCRRDRTKFAAFIRSNLVGRSVVPHNCNASTTSLPISVQSKRTYLAAARQNLPAAHIPTLPKYPTSDPSKAEVRPIAAVMQQLPTAQIPTLPITENNSAPLSLPDSYQKRSDVEVTLSKSAFQPIYSPRPAKLPPNIVQSCWYIDGAPFHAPHNYIPERKTIYTLDDFFGISNRDRIPCDSNIAESGSFPDTEGKYSLSNPSYTRPTCPLEKFSPEAFVNQEVLQCAGGIKSLPFLFAYCISRIQTIRVRTWDHYVFLGGLCPTPLHAQFRLWTFFYEPWWLPTLRFGGITDE